MHKGPPKQEPTESTEWNDWRDYHAPDKSAEFNYQDSTSENIGGGESQKFEYKGNDLPEKM